MSRRRSHIQQLLRQIEQLTEVERCELLEQILLRDRRSELGWHRIDEIRAKLPGRTERQIKRDVDAAVRQVRRELASRP